MDGLRLPVHVAAMLSHAEIVAHIRRLVDDGTPQVEIADVLKVPPPRVSDILNGTRRVKLDEAKSLVDRYGLEKPTEAERQPISEAIARLMVLHVLTEAGARTHAEKVEALAQDFQAFSRFVSDPDRRSRPELVEGMFAGRRMLRQEGQA